MAGSTLASPTASAGPELIGGEEAALVEQSKDVRTLAGEKVLDLAVRIDLSRPELSFRAQPLGGIADFYLKDVGERVRRIRREKQDSFARMGGGALQGIGR